MEQGRKLSRSTCVKPAYKRLNSESSERSYNIENNHEAHTADNEGAFLSESQKTSCSKES